MRSTSSTIRAQTKEGWKSFPISPDGISFEDFKAWLRNHPEAAFSNVIVRRKSKRTMLRYLGLNNSKDQAINAEEADLILDAYNELLAEKRINEDNKLNFEKFIVDGREEEYVGYLTKKQFQNLIKLGVSRFRNIDIFDKSPQRFHFSSLALHCGKRVDVVDGILHIPDNTELTHSEWTMLRREPISFSLGKNTTVQNIADDASPGMKNYSFEYGYKTKSIDNFKGLDIHGVIDLSTIQKTPCRGFNIQNATFTGPVNLCNAVFNKSETNGADFEKGIIFNSNTDFSKWSGNVKMPDDAQIVYVNEKGETIRTTVGELYGALKEKYSDSRRKEFFRGLFGNLFGNGFITDTLEAKDKSGKAKLETNGEKLFELLRHMQEQKNKWGVFNFLTSHRTLDAFNTTINSLAKKPQQAQQPISQPAPQQPERSDLVEGAAKDSDSAVVHTPEDGAAAAASSGSSRSSSTIDVPEAETPVVKGSTTPLKKLTKEELLHLVTTCCENTWFATALEHVRKNSNILVRAEIENLILTIKNAIYQNILTYHDSARVKSLSNFLDSDFAKNNMSREFYKKMTYFVKAAPLSIELTQILVYLKNKPGEFYADKLANLFYLANQAQISGFNYLYWTHYESCDFFKKSAADNNTPAYRSLADILPDGEYNKIDRLINTNAIQVYILTELGLMSHITKIANAVNNFLNLYGWTMKDGKILPPQNIARSSPIYNMLYILQDVNNKLTGKEMYDPADLLKGMNEVVKKLESLVSKKERDTLISVKEAVDVAQKECKARLDSFSKALALKKAQQLRNPQSLMATPATRIAPPTPLLSYLDVKALLEDVVWKDHLGNWTNLEPENRQNKVDWKLSADIKTKTMSSLQKEVLEEINTAITACITACLQPNLTDDDRLSELQKVHDKFKKVAEESQSEMCDSVFYRSIDTALEAINEKICDIKKKLSGTTSSTNRQGMFGGSAAAAAAAAATNNPTASKPHSRK